MSLRFLKEPVRTISSILQQSQDVLLPSHDTVLQFTREQHNNVPFLLLRFIDYKHNSEINVPPFSLLIFLTEVSKNVYLIHLCSNNNLFNFVAKELII